MDDIKHMVANSSPRLLDQVRLHIRNHGLAYQTEKTYIFWIKQYIYFHNKTHPKLLGSPEVGRFLSYLSNVRHCSINTQRTALNALAYLYKRFFNIPLQLIEYEPAKAPKRLPVVYSRGEIAQILSQLRGSYRTMVELMYGSGLRQAELLSLRVKDIDFSSNNIIVRSGKRQ